jgi:hypothetical protein
MKSDKVGSRETTDKYRETYERTYGWKCWFCGEKNKSEQCTKCKLDRDAAEIK